MPTWSGPHLASAGDSIVRRLNGVRRLAALGRPVDQLWFIQVAHRLLHAPAHSERHELLDQAEPDPAELRGNLRDLARVNRLLAGHRLTTRALDALVAADAAESLDLFDVATGGADLLPALDHWASRHGRTVRLVACDLNPAIVRIARHVPARTDLVVADALHLPFGAGSFDVTCCSMLLHHLTPAEATICLREMRRVARRGVVVNDLVRSWTGFLGAKVLTRLTTRNRMTRHDAPLSTLRAYTMTELTELLVGAGLRPIATHRFAGYRVAVACR